MKIHKLIAAGFLASSFAGLSYGTTEVINIVGSTAYRTFVTEAEVAVCGGVGAAQGAADSAFNTTNGSNGSTHSLVTGTITDPDTSATVTVIYRNYWTGSLSGVIDLTQGTKDPFIPTNATVSLISSGGSTYSSSYDNEAPNAAMSDAQASDCAACIANAPTPGPGWASTILTSSLQDAGNTAGPNQTVGLVTFQWVLGKLSSGSAPFTNITSQQASALVTNGVVPLSLFTGVTSDSSNYVVFIGRNEDSGTRILTFGESQGGGLSGSWAFGQGTNQLMIQQSGEGAGYASGYPTSSGTSIAIGTSVTGMKFWPASWPLNTEPSMNWNLQGHSGYTGGGDVAKVLETPNPVSTTGMSLAGTGIGSGHSVYIVSCLGCSDAKTAITGGGTALSYNGVSYNSANTANIAAGQYSPWNFEHCYYLTASTGNQVAVGANQGAADALADQIFSTPTATLTPVGVNFNDLVIGRAFPAGSYPF